jgi:hypothetical protein
VKEEKMAKEMKISIKHKIIWDEMFRYFYKGIEFVIVMDHKYLKGDGKYYPPDDDAFMSQIPAEFWDNDERFMEYVAYCIKNPEYAKLQDIPLGLFDKSKRYCNENDYKHIKNMVDVVKSEKKIL